jgi:Cft2 family RNA processing exonuclease
MTDLDSFTMTPLGGAQEVGRSCYHVQLGEIDVLVDCGLKQSSPVAFPEFESLSHCQIDAVFLTHAHIDHIGGLPVLEHDGYLADDAPIIATQPTAALASILLSDSLKIHEADAARHGEQQRYIEPDVEAVLDRLETRKYGTGVFHDLQYQYGSAGHLLGSAWLALENNLRRVVFSGDLGGRSGHLRGIDTPPSADVLVLESTYGDTDTHPSFSGARTTLWDEVVAAVKQDIPVLLPTFAVGRAQELLQLFNNRIRSQQAPTEVLDAMDIVYDGMINDSMHAYHAFVRNEWLAKSVINYKEGHSDSEPFLPKQAWTPSTMAERERLFSGKTDRTPVIVAPSGMFTGGWSPWYLWQFTKHYDTARVFITGFQAAGTPGRQLLEAEETPVSVDITALMSPDQADHVLGEREFGIHHKTIKVPRNWIGRITGFSAHAARQGLLHFARDVDPASIHLIHGEVETVKALRNHLQENMPAMVAAAASGVTVPIEWTDSKDTLPSQDDASEAGNDKKSDVPDESASIETAVQAVLTGESNTSESLSASVGDGDRNEDVFTAEQEDRIRTLVRKELVRMVLHGVDRE